MNYSLIISLAFFLSMAFSSKSQSANITYINYNDTSDVGMSIEIEYPVISTGNSNTDFIINQNIRRDILSDTLTVSIDSVLANMAIGLSAFWFNTEITYNKNDMISIIVNCEFCGANCDGYTESFVYSLNTGHRLFITDLIDTTLFYSDVLIPDVCKQYQSNINKILKLIDSSPKLIENEQDYYDYYIGSYKHSRDEFKVNSFCLYNESLKIFDECTFNRIDSPMCPELNFSYSYAILTKYMKVKI